MRYKTLVTTKLDSLKNNLNNIKSLLSQPNVSREQFEQWFELMNSKIEEIQVLVNSEQG